MKLLVCDNCDARHHSAAAERLAAAGARCERCGSALTVREPRNREVLASVPETGPGRLRRPG